MTDSQRPRNEVTLRPRIEVAAGGFVLVMNPPFIHLVVSDPSRATFERLGPPRFFAGERAQHLTIPIEPLLRGPNAGKFNIHLTYDAGPRSRRRTVALLEPGELAAAFMPFAAALYRHYLCVARSVTIDGLRRDGFSAMLMSEQAKRWTKERFDSPRWKLRVTESKLLHAARECEFYDVGVLEDLREESNHETVMVLDEKQERLYAVAYRHESLGPQHPPGWYAMPLDENCFQPIIEDVFLAGLSPRFFDVLLDIARELQADVDVDALERARERALVASSSPALGNGSSPNRVARSP